MIEVTKIIEWDMGHRVPNHKNKCRHPHGHRYRLELSVTGPLDHRSGSSSEGMVLDFGDLKAVLSEHIHDVLDHGFMIYEKDPVLAPFADVNQDFTFVKVPFIPTVENIVSWCYEQVKENLPKHLRVSRLRLYETPNSWADFIVGADRPESQ